MVDEYSVPAFSPAVGIIKVLIDSRYYEINSENKTIRTREQCIGEVIETSVCSVYKVGDKVVFNSDKDNILLIQSYPLSDGGGEDFIMTIRECSIFGIIIKGDNVVDIDTTHKFL